MSDGSDEPHVVDPMVALARDGADVVSASRYMKGGHQIGGPPLKRLMSRTAGLTLHWFGGVATHDPTNNFKLYSRSFLESVTIESTAGFELALELTVKATLAGRQVAEVPTTWRDRTEGQSNFKLRQWLPHYLHWYAAAFRGRLHRSSRSGPASGFCEAIESTPVSRAFWVLVAFTAIDGAVADIPGRLRRQRRVLGPSRGRRGGLRVGARDASTGQFRATDGAGSAPGRRAPRTPNARFLSAPSSLQRRSPTSSWQPPASWPSGLGSLPIGGVPGRPGHRWRSALSSPWGSWPVGRLSPSISTRRSTYPSFRKRPRLPSGQAPIRT